VKDWQLAFLADKEKSGKDHPAMSGKGKTPHSNMPDSMKEAMKKMRCDASCTANQFIRG